MSDQSTSEAALLRVLAECFPYPAVFDASSISAKVQSGLYDRGLPPQLGWKLLSKLRFLNPRVLYRSGHLSTGSRNALDKWLWKIDGHERGDLILRRDKYGWCRVSSSVV